jgi:polar amino acid transport system substrate-binding protein
MTIPTPRGAALAALLALTCAAAAGCGSSGGDNSASTGGSGAAGAGAAKPGALIVATDPTYAPDEFVAKDGKTIIGFDPDLAVALGHELGRPVKVLNATFDSIIPGLAAHKYDLALSSHNDTKERQKTVDFVDYFRAGSSFYVKASGGPAIDTLADLCGHHVAAEKGTTQADDAMAQDKRCRADGKPGVTALVFPDQNGANLALSSGRADVAMADTPVASYIVRQSGGQFKMVGKQYAKALHGIAVPKDTNMAKPVLKALKALIADGTYARILKHWGVADIAIARPQINGATS